MSDFRNKFLSRSLKGEELVENWEHTSVRELLRDRDTSFLKEVYRTSEAMHGVSQLSLQAFAGAFTEFPIFLTAYSNSKKINGLSFAKLFNSFSKHLFLDQYVAAVEAATSLGAATKAVGCVVKWPRVVGGLIVHDYIYDFGADGLRLLYTGDGYRVTVEPFRQFIQALPDDAFRF